jgi:hypothetical protein
VIRGAGNTASRDPTGHYPRSGKLTVSFARYSEARKSHRFRPAAAMEDPGFEKKEAS